MAKPRAIGGPSQVAKIHETGRPRYTGPRAMEKMTRATRNQCKVGRDRFFVSAKEVKARTLINYVFTK